MSGAMLHEGAAARGASFSAIDTALTDDLYEKLLILEITGADGNVIRTRAPHSGEPRDEVVPPRVQS